MKTSSRLKLWNDSNTFSHTNINRELRREQKLGEGVGARTEGWASTLRMYSAFAFPSKRNLPPKNLRLLNFEPHPPRARSARKCAFPPFGAPPPRKILPRKLPFFFF